MCPHPRGGRRAPTHAGQQQRTGRGLGGAPLRLRSDHLPPKLALYLQKTAYNEDPPVPPGLQGRVKGVRHLRGPISPYRSTPAGGPGSFCCPCLAAGGRCCIPAGDRPRVQALCDAAAGHQPPGPPVAPRDPRSPPVTPITRMWRGTSPPCGSVYGNGGDLSPALEHLCPTPQPQEHHRQEGRGPGSQHLWGGGHSTPPDPHSQKTPSGLHADLQWREGPSLGSVHPSVHLL